jgi:PAS domain S-box-containing protein
LVQRSPSTTAVPAGLLAQLDVDEQAAAVALLRATSHVSALFDAVGTVRWVSDSITAVLGYAPEEFVGTSVLRYLHPHDAETAVGLLEFGAVNPTDGGLDRDDVETPVDFRMRHRDGRWVTMEVLFNNFVATPGIHGSLTIAREATGRHTLDRALMALARDTGSDEPLRRLLAFLEIKVSGTDAGLYWPDGDDQWTAADIDPALLTSDGPWVEALKRREHVVVPDLRQPVADLVAPELADAAVAAGYVACWSVPIPAPRHPRFAGSSGPRPGQDRDPLGALVLWSRNHREPLTGHLATIEQVAALGYLCLSRREADRERAARLAMELEQNRRLQELDAMKTDLVLSVSHELRTPLTSIISFAELLDEDPTTRSSADGAQYASVIKRNAERLLWMVGDLLFLGRLEAGISPLTIGPVDLPATVDAAVEEARPAAGAKGVVIRSETGRGRPFSGDPERVRQLVDNLLSNAVKYSETGGSVRVSAQPDPEGWRLVVADDGIGIPRDEVRQVFERFYRGSNARQAQIAGSGLGLVIAQAVATLHHGSIELSSEEGRGSTFAVVLRGA